MSEELLAFALEIVGEEDDWSDTSIWLNCHIFYPSEADHRELLRMVAKFAPVREQLESLRDMIVEALAA